jgi:hypothetical protein
MAAILRGLLPSYRGGLRQMGWRLACIASGGRMFASYIHGSWPLALITFSIFLLSRPYPGIIQDAYIYIGRALADLDSDGVGRDMMFVHDGQFGFSIFRPIAAMLVALWGPAFAAEGLALAAMAGWFWAAFTFSRRLIGGAAVWAILIFAALLPASYGAPCLFSFAEPLAIPRPFSEAFVLAALAALARGATAYRSSGSPQLGSCIRSCRFLVLAFTFLSWALRTNAGFSISRSVLPRSSRGARSAYRY